MTKDLGRGLRLTGPAPLASALMVNDLVVVDHVMDHVMVDFRHPAVILVTGRAGRIVVRQGGRGDRRQKGRAGRGDQKTLHSQFL